MPSPTVDSTQFAHRWFDPYRELIETVGWPGKVAGRNVGHEGVADSVTRHDDDVGPAWLEQLNRLARQRDLHNGSGLPLRFAPAEAMPAAAYETTIASSGVVPTRLHGDDAWHDYFNALVWLRFPAIKSRLNSLQSQAILAGDEPGDRCEPGRARGRLRDMLTLFDESAALVITDDTRCANDLRGFAWSSLFVQRRQAWSDSVRVVIVGHALLLKLMRPYKAICAQAWLATAGPASSDVDRSIAASLTPASLSPGCLTPLPVLGLPGWWQPNEDADFYADAKVFRSGRRR